MKPGGKMTSDHELAKRATLAAKVINSAQTPTYKKEAAKAGLALLSLSSQVGTTYAQRLIKLFDEWVKDSL